MGGGGTRAAVRERVLLDAGSTAQSRHRDVAKTLRAAEMRRKAWAAAQCGRTPGSPPTAGVRVGTQHMGHTEPGWGPGNRQGFAGVRRAGGAEG